MMPAATPTATPTAAVAATTGGRASSTTTSATSAISKLQLRPPHQAPNKPQGRWADSYFRLEE
jgi:hypothetical protein